MKLKSKFETACASLSNCNLVSSLEVCLEELCEEQHQVTQFVLNLETMMSTIF